MLSTLPANLTNDPHLTRGENHGYAHYYTTHAPRFQDLTGLRFGRMTVVRFAGLDKRRNSRWLRVCDCGQERHHSPSNIKRGTIISCGCSRHGPRVEERAADHPDFRIFCGMMSRCHGKHSRDKKRYGLRGIAVCDRWREGGFWAFIADMGPRPTPDHSIDRINNDGPYSPENCRWATAKEQQRNTRTNKRLAFNGETLTMAEWAERLGIKYKTLEARIRKGWPLETALAPRSFASHLPEHVKATIQEERAKGRGVCEIARMLGVPHSTVSDNS